MVFWYELSQIDLAGREFHRDQTSFIPKSVPMSVDDYVTHEHTFEGKFIS